MLVKTPNIVTIKTSNLLVLETFITMPTSFVKLNMSIVSKDIK